MGSGNDLETLSKKEFELIKSNLFDLPGEPFARVMAIAQVIHDSGICEERLTDAFYEVCKRAN